MLRLAAEHNKLLRVPVIRKLKEAAPRAGFFEQDQYLAVRAKLPEAGTLRLDPGTSKNDDGRLVHLTPELKTLLTVQVERVKTLERTLGRVIAFSSRTSRGAIPARRTARSARSP